MGLFEDFSRFLETRLEEFLRNNPHLELQALEEQLREQEEEALRLMADLRLKEKQAQDNILATAQEIQRWHERIGKAKTAGRWDLVKPAEEREAALLREGNQRWGQMQVLKERMKQTEELQRKIQARRQEVRAKAVEAEAARASANANASAKTEPSWQTIGWNQSNTYLHNSADPLEAQFKRWEMDEELDQLKRNMGR
ncbi:TIGR04376 family protein [Trichocoleus desertorum]|uniref:TIGR04376 family protein n=1 Tax=Trichocoleus desertorum GB2-A4 TaxID=2933944 RepID=A0ABV0J3K9_9CYAN|nr:TIGR04376 family protein [Trichocoleus sp. FACHB-46]